MKGKKKIQIVDSSMIAFSLTDPQYWWNNSGVTKKQEFVKV